jgi:hypothetical protein
MCSAHEAKLSSQHISMIQTGTFSKSAITNNAERDLRFGRIKKPGDRIQNPQRTPQLSYSFRLPSSRFILPELDDVGACRARTCAEALDAALSDRRTFWAT